MEVVKNIVVTLVVLMLVAAILSVSVFIYEYQFKKKEVYREGSPNGEYNFILYQVGQPRGLLGPVKAEIKLLNANGKTVDKKSMFIYTDGGQLHQSVIKEIYWRDTTLEFEYRDESGGAACVLEFAT